MPLKDRIVVAQCKFHFFRLAGSSNLTLICMKSNNFRRGRTSRIIDRDYVGKLFSEEESNEIYNYGALRLRRIRGEGGSICCLACCIYKPCAKIGKNFVFLNSFLAQLGARFEGGREFNFRQGPL